MKEKKMARGVLLENIDPKKILWVGGYPAHYVRQMHLTVEEMRPGVMHFIYVVDDACMHERNYEQGQLPHASTVLATNYPVKQVLQILRKLRPKALIITGYNRRLLVAILLWSYLKKKCFCFWCDTNILITVNGGSLIRFIKAIILNLIFSRAYKYLYIGSRNRDFYIWLMGLHLATDKLFFLPYPAMLEKVPTTTPLECEDPSQQGWQCLNILYLGRLEPIKAVHKLINALALLPIAIRNNVHLDIYGGGGDEKRLQESAVDYGLAELVSFHGPVASDQVAQCYRKADIFVLPSDREPWGLVVNEALLAGVPVMCPFWVGAAADLITDGETGYILENNTPECIAAGIERAYHAGLANKQLGIKGRDRVTRAGWNLERASTRLVSLVDDLLIRAVTQ